MAGVSGEIVLQDNPPPLICPNKVVGKVPIVLSSLGREDSNLTPEWSNHETLWDNNHETLWDNNENDNNLSLDYSGGKRDDHNNEGKGMVMVELTEPILRNHNAVDGPRH